MDSTPKFRESLQLLDMVHKEGLLKSDKPVYVVTKDVHLRKKPKPSDAPKN